MQPLGQLGGGGRLPLHPQVQGAEGTHQKPHLAFVSIDPYPANTPQQPPTHLQWHSQKKEKLPLPHLNPLPPLLPLNLPYPPPSTPSSHPQFPPPSCPAWPPAPPDRSAAAPPAPPIPPPRRRRRPRRPSARPGTWWWPELSDHPGAPRPTPPPCPPPPPPPIFLENGRATKQKWSGYPLIAFFWRLVVWIVDCFFEMVAWTWILWRIKLAL